jgi:predicted O-methyltransferase YrrM
MNFPFVIDRILHRLQRITPLHAPVERIRDRMDLLAFLSQKATRRDWRAQLAACKEIADFHTIAAAMFEPHQIPDEIIRFLKLARAENPRAVCEIGTASGGTNFLLGHALPEVELLFGLDLFVRRKTQLRHFARPGQRMIYLDGSSYSQKTISRVETHLAGRKLDLLFIDGDHTYQGVRNDFFAYRRFVRAGGIIAFHDIVPDHFTRFGRQTGRWAGDVPLFWEKIKPFYPAEEIIADPGQDGLGIGVIRYSPQTPLPAEL